MMRSTETVATLCERFEAAVNAGDAVASEELTGTGVSNDYTWIREWRESGGTSARWRAGVLSMGGARLVQVSRPQVCQSTSDHLYALAGSAGRPQLGREIGEDELIGARVTAHHLDVSFDVPSHSVSITDVARLTRAPTSLGVAVVRLNEYFRLSEATMAGRSVPYAQSGGFVAVPAPSQTETSLRLRYSARLDRRGESFFASDEAALTAYWYPHTGRLPATSVIRITAPHGWRSIGPGERVREAAGDGAWTSEWRNTLPVSYLTVAAGLYRETVQTSDGVRIAAWTLGSSEARAARMCQAAATAVRGFGRAFANYPYSSFTVVESRVFPPALEGYSFTLAGSGTLPDVVTHEVSHTWWGGLVPNTYTRSMWNEAFATYSEDLLDRLGGPAKSSDPGTGAWRAAATLPSGPPLRRVRDAMHPSHSAIGYQKGGLVLAQLERLLGTEAMLRCLREFVSRHTRGEAADWRDFEDAVCAAAGSEWRGFFNAWLSGTEIPAFALRDTRVATVAGGYRVTGSVIPSSPGFWSLAPLVLRTSGSPVRTSVGVRGEPVKFSIASRDRPVALSLDPEGLMLRSGDLAVVADLTGSR